MDSYFNLGLIWFLGFGCGLLVGVLVFVLGAE